MKMPEQITACERLLWRLGAARALSFSAAVRHFMFALSSLCPCAAYRYSARTPLLVVQGTGYGSLSFNLDAPQERGGARELTRALMLYFVYQLVNIFFTVQHIRPKQFKCSLR